MQRLMRGLNGLEEILGQCGFLSYLLYMGQRLLVLKSILKPTGSLYLHCDPTASHYLKVLLNAIFGEQNFRNEIVWHYHTGGASKTHFSRKHDIILYYTRERRRNFFDPIREPYREEKSDHFTGISKEGRRYRIRTIAGKEYQYYLDKGRICHDVWEIDALNAAAKERLGYPTQKPLALLERIIRASCPPGGVVLDPFCGSGSALEAAERLERRWIGIDISWVTVAMVRECMQRYKPSVEAVVVVDQHERGRLVAPYNIWHSPPFSFIFAFTRPNKGFSHCHFPI